MQIPLRKIRESRNVTQVELAEHINVSQQYISQIERGLFNVTLPVACEIADYLNVSLDELAGRKFSDKTEN